MKKFVVACFALSAVSCGAQNSSLSSESGRPISMGLIGDSISTGVLADTQLGGSLSESIKSDIIKHVIGGNYDAGLFQKRFSRPDLAAATTDQPWGYRASLAAKHGIDVSQVKVFSAARFGGRYAHVQSEINLLQDLYARENAGQKPDYVTVLLGGNDFCKGRSVEEFATEAESALKLVLSSHPDSRVLFSLVPPLWKLRNHKHTYSYKVNFGISFTMSSKVDDIRKIECDALYKGNVEGKVHAY
ncbi:MAG: GDSL-type esterase/lipase family protein, partial [Pseudobdellovibrionaceae bacterium]|nr:GDSL-type esterase/lipase family protein [Pseudobdellovibrionaceae bacterium]